VTLSVCACKTNSEILARKIEKYNIRREYKIARDHEASVAFFEEENAINPRSKNHSLALMCPYCHFVVVKTIDDWGKKGKWMGRTPPLCCENCMFDAKGWAHQLWSHVNRRKYGSRYSARHFFVRLIAVGKKSVLQTKIGVSCPTHDPERLREVIVTVYEWCFRGAGKCYVCVDQQTRGDIGLLREFMDSETGYNTIAKTQNAKRRTRKGTTRLINLQCGVPTCRNNLRPQPKEATVKRGVFIELLTGVCSTHSIGSASSRPQEEIVWHALDQYASRKPEEVVFIGNECTLVACMSDEYKDPRVWSLSKWLKSEAVNMDDFDEELRDEGIQLGSEQRTEAEHNNSLMEFIRLYDYLRKFARKEPGAWKFDFVCVYYDAERNRNILFVFEIDGGDHFAIGRHVNQLERFRRDEGAPEASIQQMECRFRKTCTNDFAKIVCLSHLADAGLVQDRLDEGESLRYICVVRLPAREMIIGEDASYLRKFDFAHLCPFMARLVPHEIPYIGATVCIPDTHKNAYQDQYDNRLQHLLKSRYLNDYNDSKVIYKTRDLYRYSALKQREAGYVATIPHVKTYREWLLLSEEMGDVPSMSQQRAGLLGGGLTIMPGVDGDRESDSDSDGNVPMDDV